MNEHAGLRKPDTWNFHEERPYSHSIVAGGFPLMS